jgi:glycosyltransferase involved in cell wall biosynthesis
MRIVYLSASSIPSRNANSIHVMRMCEALGKNGHEVILVGKQYNSSPTEDIYGSYGVERAFELSLIPCRRIKGVGLFVLPKLYLRLRQYDPKEVLIYARDIYGASMAIRMGFRVIYEAHGLPYNRLIRHLETRLLAHRSLLRLVVISEALKDLYMSRFDVADRVVVCHDAACMPSRSSNGDLPWPACRDTLQIGYTGHLHQGRGIEIIVECARRLPQYDFHVIGGDDKDILHWRQMASANLCFHGFVEPGLISSVCRHCDVLLMPYQTNLALPYTQANTSAWMSPMKLFEYMASRKAIIASDLPVLREVLDDRMAVLVSPGETDQWAEAIKRCEDGQFRDNLAQNAYEAFLKDYRWEKRAKKVLEGIGA